MIQDAATHATGIRFGWKHSSSPNYLRELSYLVPLWSKLPFTWISWAMFQTTLMDSGLPPSDHCRGGWSRGIFTRTFLTHTVYSLKFPYDRWLCRRNSWQAGESIWWICIYMKILHLENFKLQHWSMKMWCFSIQHRNLHPHARVECKDLQQQKIALWNNLQDM